jgi:uncharacterized protein (TIGR02147 family)
MKTTQPSIYEYNDFRKFIADFQKAQQATDRTYTKSHMTQLLGLPNSRSYMSDVLKGKLVTTTFIDRFVRLFGFNQDEAFFFRILVKFNQADNPGDRELYFEQLISLNKTPKRYLYQQSYQYYKDWYNAALRALLNVYDFNGNDFRVIAQKLVPAISVPQAKKAFSLLLKLNLIGKNSKGVYKPTDSSISTEEFVKDEILKQFQLKCHECSKSSIIKDSGLTQVIATNTISVLKNGLKRYRKTNRTVQDTGQIIGAHSPRSGHTSVVFDNKMWVIGGYDHFQNKYTNDVWFSSDGETWTQAEYNERFSPRMNHTCTIYENRMWVIGGENPLLSSISYSDVWFSSNGIDWTQVTAPVGIGSRAGHSCVVFDEKMWVIGGVNGGASNDVWYFKGDGSSTK